MCLASILPVNEAVKLIIIAVIEKSETKRKKVQKPAHRSGHGAWRSNSGFFTGVYEALSIADSRFHASAQSAMHLTIPNAKRSQPGNILAFVVSLNSFMTVSTNA